MRSSAIHSKRLFSGHCCFRHRLGHIYRRPARQNPQTQPRQAVRPGHRRTVSALAVVSRKQGGDAASIVRYESVCLLIRDQCSSVGGGCRDMSNSWGIRGRSGATRCLTLVSFVQKNTKEMWDWWLLHGRNLSNNAVRRGLERTFTSHICEAATTSKVHYHNTTSFARRGWCIPKIRPMLQLNFPSRWQHRQVTCAVKH